MKARHQAPRTVHLPQRDAKNRDIDIADQKNPIRRSQAQIP
ncbi:hypothetical protein [Komagataeibacter swingsii]|nr:hypothetical protein [Komagataeibacter swingsii]